MRYSVFEYSQEKLVSLNLDVVDALLLNWFANFFCGNMEKKIFKDTEGNSKIYGWVKISKILEDLPVIGITSEKGIRLRFDSFVEKGILDRESINTQKGKKSYYKTTSVYDSLINTVAIEKVQKETISEEQNTTESSQGNCTTFAEDSTKEKEEKISHESFFTFAKNETENSNRKSSQRNCTTFAERNENTFAQGNCTTFALNNSLINDSLINDSSATDKNNSHKSEEELILIKIYELFSNKVYFSDDMPHKISVSLRKSEIEVKNYEAYIQWAYDYLKSRCKNLEDFPGYFYKSISESSLIYKFNLALEELKTKEIQKQAELVTCKVCGTTHSMYENCPECDNDFFDLQRLTPEEIQKRKKVYNFPPEVKAQYKAEIESIYLSYPNIIAAFANPITREQINKQIKTIEKNYGLEEISYEKI